MDLPESELSDHNQRSYTFPITDEVLPSSFKNEICKTDPIIIIRSNLSGSEDILKWISEFSQTTTSRWRVRSTFVSSSKMVCAKIYWCHRSGLRATDSATNKSKKTGCKARISIKIKLTTQNTIKKDSYVKRGLPAVIKICNEHNHPVSTDNEIKWLQWDDEVRNKFIAYFDEGLQPTDAFRQYKNELSCLESSKTPNGGLLCPSRRTIRWWFQEWKHLKDDLMNLPNEDLKNVFVEYFSLGMGPLEARRVHFKKLTECGGDTTDVSCMPKARLISHWYNEWNTVNEKKNKIKEIFIEYFRSGSHWKSAIHKFEKAKHDSNILDVAAYTTSSIWAPSENIVRFWFHEFKLEKKNLELSQPEYTELVLEKVIHIDYDGIEDIILPEEDIVLPEEDIILPEEDIILPGLSRSELIPRISAELQNLDSKFGDQEDASCYERILNKLLQVSNREEWKAVLNSIDESMNKEQGDYF